MEDEPPEMEEEDDEEDRYALTQRTFLVLGLPRSRTAWMSQMLTVGESFCSHDLTARCDTAEDAAFIVRERDYAMSGNSDSGNFFILDKFMELLPSTDLVWIQNDPEKVIRSMARVTNLSRERFRHPIERLCSLQNKFLN